VADPFLTESGKIMAVSLGQYLKKNRFDPSQFGNRIYTSPAFAAVETASCVLDGLAGEKIAVSLAYHSILEIISTNRICNRGMISVLNLV